MMQQFQSPTHENSATPESRDVIDSSLAMDTSNLKANFSNNDDNFPSKMSNYQKMHGGQSVEQHGMSPNNYQINDNGAATNRRSGGTFQRAEVDMARIQNICNELNLVVAIENTQRTITRSDGCMDHEKGAEVFIGKLPRDVFEDELLPLVNQLGSIVEFRIMLDYNGFNRGYAFVTYKTRQEASKALKALNNYELRKGKLLGVCRSVDNCRLFVGGIPKTKKKHEIREEMQKVTEGVADVIVYPSAADKTKNRGFAFVEYESHKSAAMARRKLMPGKIQLWNQPIAVDWAEPEVDVDDDVMAQVKILYIRNLMLHTREETLEAIFRKITGPATIERVKKIRDYAFVHFNTRENAAKAMKAVHGMDIDGSHVEVTWAKPVDREAYAKYNKHSRVNQFIHHQALGRQFLPLTADQLSNLTTTSNIYGIPAHVPIDSAGTQQITIGQQSIPVILNTNPRAPPQVFVAPAQPGVHARGHYGSRGMPHNSYRNTGYNNYQFQRNKPRGAGGVRAVGSRQYLNSRSGQEHQRGPQSVQYPADLTASGASHAGVQHPSPFTAFHGQYVLSQDLMNAEPNVVAHHPVILAPATISQVPQLSEAADVHRAESLDEHGGNSSVASTAHQHVVHSIIPSQLGVYNTPRQLDTRAPTAPSPAAIQAITTTSNPLGATVTSAGRSAANQIMYLQPATFISQEPHDIYGSTMGGATAIQQAQNAGAFNRTAGRLPPATVASSAGLGQSYMVFPQNISTTSAGGAIGGGLTAAMESQVI